MSFEKAITIKEVINNINSRRYLLPAIQREFVWKTSQIEKLFDSIMRDYPIGSFLFWKVDKENINDYQFYDFICNYHEKNNKHNLVANPNGEEIIAILDGQQRMTSLYIGLKGSYSYKMPYYRWDSKNAFPQRFLCINLIRKSEDYDMEYDFKFCTKEEIEDLEKGKHWFKIGDILQFNKPFEINNYIFSQSFQKYTNDEKQLASEILFKMYDVFNNAELINYYLEKDKELDKVLNVFIRVNSGGTQLSYSDLLLSIATAQWKGNAREEITAFVDEINEMGEGFNFDKDFILKSCLYVLDIKGIAFKVDNFKKENMKLIEDNWEEIKKSIRVSVQLVSEFGYNMNTLTSNLSLLPIIYYIYKSNKQPNFLSSSTYKEDREKINMWLIKGLIKRIFSGQPDNILRPIRDILSNNGNYFPLKEIEEKFKGTPKSFTFNDEEIENLLEYKYSQNHTFAILQLLYPTLDYKNKFHLDHIFPRAKMNKRELKKMGYSDEKIEFYINNVDSINNLQILEGTINQEKSDEYFEIWLNKHFQNEIEKKEYFIKNYIPEEVIVFNKFEEFLAKRNQIIFERMKKILTSDNTVYKI